MDVVGMHLEGCCAETPALSDRLCLLEASSIWAKIPFPPGPWSSVIAILLESFMSMLKRKPSFLREAFVRAGCILFSFRIQLLAHALKTREWGLLHWAVDIQPNPDLREGKGQTLACRYRYCRYAASCQI